MRCDEMFEELGELILGPWGIAIAVVGAVVGTETGRQTLRKGAREVLKAGHKISDASSGVLDNMKQEWDELKKEVESEGNGRRTSKKKRAAAE